MILMEKQRQKERSVSLTGFTCLKKEEEFTSHHLKREKINSAKFTRVCRDEGGGCDSCDSLYRQTPALSGRLQRPGWTKRAPKGSFSSHHGSNVSHHWDQSRMVTITTTLFFTKEDITKNGNCKY